MPVRFLSYDMFFLSQRVQLSGEPEETHEDVNKYKLHTIISYFRVPSGIIFLNKVQPYLQNMQKLWNVSLHLGQQ